MIDCGDHIHHKPSGEDWVVAAVEGEKLYWCGYPFGGYADLSDCTLVKKATDEQRLKLLSNLAAMSRAEHLAPVRLAKARLTLPAPDKGDSPAPQILSMLKGDSTAEHEPTPAPCG